MNNLRTDRNYGIDIARCLAMFMVVVLHNLGNGGVLQSHINTVSEGTYWLLENFSSVAVNLFAMISGFLLVNQKFKIKKLFNLWGIVWFWSVMVAAVYWIFNGQLGIHELITSCFPVMTNEYWYFNAYVMLFLLMPFLNAGIKKLQISNLRLICGLLLGLSCTIGLIGNWFEEGGYSGVWLVVMYLVGALVRIDPLIKKINGIFFIALYVCGSIGTFCFEWLTQSKFSVFHWINYLSPLVVLASIGLFVWLSRLKVKQKNLKKILAFISPLTFTVYLVDNHVIVFNFIIKDFFSFVHHLGSIEGFFLIITISFLIFATCIFIEFIRCYLFGWIKIKINNVLQLKN